MDPGRVGRRQLHRYLLPVSVSTSVLTPWSDDNPLSQGLYPLKSFPAPIGKEATGTIVQLPTDEKVLNDPAFQKFDFAVGSKTR